MHTPDNFLGLEPAWCDPATARYAVLPLPYEATVSYGHGTAAGPRAIIQASQQVELFDGTGEPAAAGILTEAPVVFAGRSPEEDLAAIRTCVEAILDAGRLPIGLGGEHTVTFPCVEALWRRRQDFGVVQFDAHADLREEYGGTPWSHACVMRRVHELGVPLFQVGVRSLSRPEAEYRARHGIGHLDAAAAGGAWPEPLLPDDFPPNVYLTFDVDALDPAVVPATGTPEPGGLGWYQALAAIAAVARRRRILAFDVVELAPVPGLHLADFAVAKLVYAIIGTIEHCRHRG